MEGREGMRKKGKKLRNGFGVEVGVRKKQNMGSSSSRKTDTNWMFDRFSGIQRKLSEIVASLSLPSVERLPPEFPRPQQISDYVYEVCKPTIGRPSVELVFFHGLQLDGSEEAYITTWVSQDRSTLWLNWLVEDFPNARILIISYDAASRRTCSKGNTDMYMTRENLVNSLIGMEAPVGQDGCPVILVGHSLGGQVLKELCVQADSMLNENSSNEALQNLFWNIKGLFFYATPHGGSRMADNTATEFRMGLLFEDKTAFNTATARLNGDFRELRKQYGWRTSAVGERREVRLGQFEGLVVTHASASFNVDKFYSIDADHFQICRPESRLSASFYTLRFFVDEVLKEDTSQFPPELQIYLPDEVVGLESQTKRVEQMLRETRRLGIVGMGGIGKTTLAMAVFHEISGKFEYTCFLYSVKHSIRGKEQSIDLRKQIIDNLYFRGRKVSTTFDWTTLREKKVLIILDDAEFEFQVDVMTKTDRFSDESRLIVTSRDRGFLIPLDFAYYVADQLSLDDSKELFCLHAFKNRVAPRGYEEQVMKFAKKCGGLPLALQVVGEYLYHQQDTVWDDALKKIGLAQSFDGSHQDRLWSSLRVSYDSLAPTEQEMFLDAATVFHGKGLIMAQDVWRGWGWAAESGWENLVARGLVTISVWGDIDMPRPLRVLGQSIACPDPQDITTHIRISDTNTANQLSDVLSARRQRGQIPTAKVEVLSLTGDKTCDRFDTSVIQHLKHLRILRLQNLSLTMLPESIRQLQELSYLQICDCPKLRALPEALGQLSSLVTLTIRNCENLEILPLSFGHLQCLEGFLLRGCRQLKRLPDNFGPRMILTIEEDDQLEALSNCLPELTSLRHLTLVNVSSVTLPDAIGNLSSLVTLTIKSCKNLEGLPPSFTSFGNLDSSRELILHRCRQLQNLPDNFGPLMILTIEEDDQLKALFTCLRQLTSLRRLTLVNVRSVELPESLLFTLVMLTIRSCPISSLPSSFAGLSSLKELHIQNCPLLSTLRGLNSHDSFANEVGDSIRDPWGWFSSMENLTLSGCCITSECLCSMLYTFMRVPGLALKCLDLHDNLLGDEALHNLVTWAKSDYLQQLKELNLSQNRGIGLSGLKTLIDTIQNGHLPCLQRVAWLGNLDGDATAEAVMQAYNKDEALTTDFDVDWTQVSDTSLRTKAEEYRDSNVRRKGLKEQLKTENKPQEELHQALPLSSAESLEEKLETEDKPKEELHEDLPLFSSKVFLCGYPEVGKTTLRKTLFDPLRSRGWWFGWWWFGRWKWKEPRTRGIELSRVEEMTGNEDSLTLVLWDLAGQEEFHVLHSSFFPDLGFAGGKATTFALVFNAVWRKKVEQDLKYWLGFVAASSLTHAKRHVVIVLNQFRGKQCSDDHLQRWKNLVELYAEKFDDLLQIHPDPIIIDARDPQSVQALKERLFNHARKLLDNVMVPGVCIQLLRVLKEWRQGEKNHFPILSWQAFEDILKKKYKGTQWSGKLLKTSALYLHEIGEIIFFDNNEQAGAGSERRGVVVPEPEWFCRHIVGELLLPKEMLGGKGKRLIDVGPCGSIRMTDFICSFAHKLAEGTLHDDVISMLEQMGLGYKKGVEEIIIPALISKDDTSKNNWEGKGSLWVMGRCLATNDDERLPIPSILFRKLQAELAQRENFGDRVDSKYIAGNSFSNFKDGEHLVLIEFGLDPSDRACGRVDILVKTLIEEENPRVRWAQIACISRIMQKLEKLCVSCCPGVKYDIKAIQPWYARDETPRMIDRNLMSLKKIKNLLSEQQRYSGWELNKKPMEWKWFLSNSELNEVDSHESARIKVRAVNDSLFELYTPPLDTPDMEILFFHGLGEEAGSEGAHISTWESGDGSADIWPQKWLAESFPRARILSVSFDSAVIRGSGSWRFETDGSDTDAPDPYLITENLASDLTQEGVGQTVNRPVIMVGHCLGGMVIKELLLLAFRSSSLATAEAPKLKRFIDSVGGIFFYDTPHQGTFLKKVADLDVSKNNLLRYFQGLAKNSARLNFDFARLRDTLPKKWRIGGLGATRPTNSGLFHGVVVVPEASSREGDSFNMIDEDHYSICKPKSKITKSYTLLVTVIKDVIKVVDTVQ